LAAAASQFEKWREIFPDVPIGLLHGRLSPEEKDRVMSSFRDNVTHILVATTVVEVGVDVPNATVMIINDADIFGLSQLHQLRGRIGRGEHKSYCILLSTAKVGEPGRDKLEVLCRTLNGFEIAEEDFRLRGPGDVLGTAQSGLGAVQFAEWLSDMRLVHRASRDAAAILDADPQLQLPEHAPLRALVAPESEQGVTA
jgi:ATP-dependent DNA helicase RecG